MLFDTLRGKGEGLGAEVAGGARLAERDSKERDGHRRQQCLEIEGAHPDQNLAKKACDQEGRRKFVFIRTKEGNWVAICALS